MANNVGNISIGLSLDNQSFAAKLDSETSRVAKFTGTLQQSSASFSASASGVNRFTASVSGLARPMQQAAFGLGDFASQMSSRGLGGGLQAAANNIQMLGAGFGPMGLAISAGIGVGVTALGVFIEQSEKAAKKAKGLEDQLRTSFKKIGEASADAMSEARVDKRVDSVRNSFLAQNATGQSSSAIESSIRDDERKLKELRARRAGLIGEFNRALPREWRDQGGLYGFANKFGISGVTSESGSLWAGMEKAAQRAKIGKVVPRPDPTGPIDAMQRLTGIGQNPMWFSGKGSWFNPLGFGTVPTEINKQKNIFSPETVSKLGKLEADIMKTNDEIASTISRAEAASRGLPGARKSEASIFEREQRSKELKGLGKESERATKEMQDRAESLLKSAESTQQRRDRQFGEIDALQRGGALSAEQADMLRKRFDSHGMRQMSSLPSFEAGSRETLTAMNRAIRGTQDTKVVEQNTAKTATAAEKLVGKMEDVRRTLSENRTQIARF